MSTSTNQVMAVRKNMCWWVGGHKGQQLSFTQTFTLKNSISSFLLLSFNSSVWGLEPCGKKKKNPVVQVKLLCLHLKPMSLSFCQLFFQAN